MNTFVSILTVTVFSALLADGSVLYIRWGRTTCPLGASIIYTGYAAGSHYTHTGSGANSICLSDRPDRGNVVPGVQEWTARVFGTEYEFPIEYQSGKPFKLDNNDGRNLHDNDVPCVLCYRGEAGASVVIPGKLSCPSEIMHLEYSGYLVAQAFRYQRSEFICLDESPEVIAGGADNLNGNLFYVAQTECGSLRCPPYGNGDEIACAVCTIS